MGLPRHITFTGFDDRTDIPTMEKLHERYPIEWGVLFSSTNQDARYPCKQATRELQEAGMHLAAHLCGKLAKAAQAGEPRIGVPLDHFDHIQINGCITRQDGIDDLMGCGYQVITQCKAFRIEIRDTYPLQLFDTSGGKGQSPKAFPKYPGHFCGYAGGIGPKNVQEVLKLINAPDRQFWIDIEGRVRTDGWFDLDKVEAVCKQVYG